MTNRIRMLRPASFRGIHFEVDSDGKDFGRRVVSHKYPGKDEVFHEDMGLDGDVISMDVWINGDDFITRSEALEKALKEKGPGTLRHPHYGDVQVLAIKASRRHNSKAIGDCDFSITFEKYDGEARYPASISNTASLLGVSSTNMLSALSGDFAAVFRAVNIPDFITSDSILRLDSLTDNLQSVLSTAGLSSFLPASLPEWVSSARLLADSIGGFFTTLGGLSKKRATPMIASSAPVIAPAPALPLASALVKASAFAASDSRSTAVRASNANALDMMFQGSSMAAAANAASSATFESREQAISFRDAYALRMTDIADALGEAGWDASWQNAQGVMAAVTNDINERIGRLPQTVAVSTKAIRSSLELAHRIYGDDIKRVLPASADIVSRNRIKHPGLIPARKLEVLIDASKR